MGMAGATPINSANLSTLAVYGGDRPLCEGPRILPILNIDFSTVTTYSLDYSNQMKMGRMSMIQTVYIDNSQNDGAATVMLSTGQQITAKGRTQGFYNCLAQEPFKVSFESTGGARVSFIFLNFSIQPAQWATQ
jgi:hypothetical protein